MILSSNSSKCNAYGYKRIVHFLQNTIETTRNLTAELYTTQYDNHLIGAYYKSTARSQTDVEFVLMKTVMKRISTTCFGSSIHLERFIVLAYRVASWSFWV